MVLSIRQNKIARGVMVSHPLRMRKARGSNPLFFTGPRSKHSNTHCHSMLYAIDAIVADAYLLLRRATTILSLAPWPNG